MAPGPSDCHPQILIFPRIREAHTSELLAAVLDACIEDLFVPSVLDRVLNENRRGGAESRAVNTEQGRGAGGTQREGAARNTHGGSDRGPLLQNAGGSAGGSVLT
ncbi:unnamed protein product [Rangifer tarandus platyrhynchus]|uniref:Uncharacterized protein n=1 Tax=Rangifer tarandus platyrhynchus TaxID=3082113 RepID=A0AC59Z2P2_RANTA